MRLSGWRHQLSRHALPSRLEVWCGGDEKPYGQAGTEDSVEKKHKHQNSPLKLLVELGHSAVDESLICCVSLNK